jgi:hypothetical protein
MVQFLDAASELLKLLSGQLFELWDLGKELYKFVLVLTICFADDLLVHVLGDSCEVALGEALRGRGSFDHLVTQLQR